MPGDRFYRTVRWSRTRAACLRRDGYLCRDCARYGKRTPATTAHHMQERTVCPDKAYALDNLISLCDACHNARHPDKGGKHWT